MNKKALSMMMTIFTILAVVLVSGLIVKTASTLGKSDITVKVNAAEDFRIMIDTLVATPGDALVKCPHNLSEFTVSVTGESVTVYKSWEQGINILEKKFYLPMGYTAIGHAEKEDYVCLEKIGRDIKLRGCREDEFESTV